MADLPGLVHDDDGVVEVAELPDVARLEAERDVGAGGRFAGLRVGDGRSLAGRIEIVLVRHSRPGSALAVDPQRGEGPLARLHLGQMRDPAVALLLPAGDLPAAGDDRPLAGVADVA